MRQRKALAIERSAYIEYRLMREFRGERVLDSKGGRLAAFAVFALEFLGNQKEGKGVIP